MTSSSSHCPASFASLHWFCLSVAADQCTTRTGGNHAMLSSIDRVAGLMSSPSGQSWPGRAKLSPGPIHSCIPMIGSKGAIMPSLDWPATHLWDDITWHLLKKNVEPPYLRWYLQRCSRIRKSAWLRLKWSYNMFQTGIFRSHDEIANRSVSSINH